MSKEGIDFVVCKLCSREFQKITNTHLGKYHSLSMKEYKKKFPKALTEIERLKVVRVKKVKGKSYEEIYGVEKANEIKKKRSKTLINTYKNNESLRSRKSVKMRRHSEKKKKEKGLKKSVCKFCGKKFWYDPKYNKGVYHNILCKNKDQRNISLKIWKTTRKDERTIKMKLIHEKGRVCEKCGKKFKRDGDLCLHHLTYDYYTSDPKNFALLCKSCHVKLHNKFRREEQNFMGLDQVKKVIYSLLKALKIPVGDPNFKDTPGRVARMYMELCSGLFLDIKKEIIDILSTVFPSENDEMIIYEGETVGMCPHHLLPVLYSYNIGIVPRKHVVGASKPQRLVELFCSVPDLQENITTKIKDSLLEILKPQGVFVLVKGKHLCMRIRGVKSNSSEVITSAIGGCFVKPEVRAEFLSLVRKDGN